MKLITKKIRNKTPKLYEQDNVHEPIVYAKFFYPYGSGTWFMLELDKDNDTAYGFVSLGLGEHCDELGYFSIKELEANNVERDIFFEPMTLSEAKIKHLSLACSV